MQDGGNWIESVESNQLQDESKQLGMKRDRNSTLEYHAKRFSSIRYHLAQPDGAVANCNDPVLRSNINSVSITLRESCE